MNIGILTYHWVSNFGANLQAYSTYSYVKKAGHNPIIIDWIPSDTEIQYVNNIPSIQRDAFSDFQKTYFVKTNLCRSASDIASEIERLNIDTVIIGSDAVLVHIPFLSRFYLSKKRIIGYSSPSSDRLFPNPYWGNFNKLLKKPIPMALLSASCQNSNFKAFSKTTIKGMKEQLSQFAYISVRDQWTKDLVTHVTNGESCAVISRDPVFAFCANISPEHYSKESIKRFNLPDKYRILSFRSSGAPNNHWISKFIELSNAEGIPCVCMAMPSKIKSYPGLLNIDHPINPLEWFSLIKYSSGYVGHNMHPMITAIHNTVPFFSFDHYGLKALECDDYNPSSKICDILQAMGMTNYRTASVPNGNYAITPATVYSLLKNFPTNQCGSFAKAAQELALANMLNISGCLSKAIRTDG